MMVDGRFFREIDENCWSPEARIAECDRDGTDIQVLSTVPVLFAYWAEPKDAHDLARLLNDHIAEAVAAHPRRFVGLGSLPLQAPDRSVVELERCVRELRLPGVQIGTHVNDWNLDHEELFPVFEKARDLGAAIFVHPWDMMARERMEKFWLPWLVGMPAETALAICSMIFGGVFDRLPDLKVCFAHGGGAFPGTLARIEKGWSVRPDLCAVNGAGNPRTYLNRFYVDSLVHDAASLRFLLALMGVEQVALGTDYPFPLGEARPGKTIELLDELSPDERERLFSGTALEFLGLEREQLAESPH